MTKPGCMTTNSPELIAAIHRSGRQGVIAVTGGGSLAVSRLLSVPGASRFLLEARVPYASAALAEWLTRAPEQACSRETALAMAVVAFQRACQLTSNGNDVAIGVGCTAALVSDRPKRGAHRAWIATQTSSTTRLIELTLEKGRRDRVAEEHVVAESLLWLLGKSCGLDSLPDFPIQDGDGWREESVDAHPLLQELFRARRDAVWNIRPNNGTTRVWQAQSEAQPRALLSGSFNPLHEGHRELARAAERRIGGPVAFELAWINVDKPPLDFLTIEARCRQFEDSPVVLTRAATFREKSRLFPNTTFIVGVDTAKRILNPKYYANESDMRAALEEIRSNGCQFLVAGRIAGDRFETLSDLNTPDVARELFVELPESEFRRDLSSTELRQQQAPHER
jgi:nicotinamide mononucleotide (NMN) deamidase PncC